MKYIAIIFALLVTNSTALSFAGTTHVIQGRNGSGCYRCITDSQQHYTECYSLCVDYLGQWGTFCGVDSKNGDGVLWDPGSKSHCPWPTGQVKQCDEVKGLKSPLYPGCLYGT